MPDRVIKTHAAIVDEGVRAFAALDDTLAAALEQAAAIEEVVKDGVAAGMVPALTGGVMIAKAGALRAKLTDAALVKYDLHADCVKAAKANGVDTGGVERVLGITVMGGGPR